jgi:hypothetical protein
MSTLKKIKKFKDFDIGQLEALVKLLGGLDVAIEILRGRKDFVLTDNVKTLADETGRCIPDPALTHFVTPGVGSIWNFPHPEINSNFYQDGFKRLSKYLGNCGVSLDQFENEAETIRQNALGHPRLANFFKGLCVPVIIPSTVCTKNPGKLVNDLLHSMIMIYRNQFLNKEFKIDIREYDGLYLELIKSCESILFDHCADNKPLIGWHLASAMHGFSIWAQREQIKSLPDNHLILSGYDTIIAYIGYPDLMTGNGLPNFSLPLFKQRFVSGYELVFMNNQDDLCFSNHDIFPDSLADSVCGGLFLFN